MGCPEEMREWHHASTWVYVWHCCSSFISLFGPDQASTILWCLLRAETVASGTYDGQQLEIMIYVLGLSLSLEERARETRDLWLDS